MRREFLALFGTSRQGEVIPDRPAAGHEEGTGTEARVLFGKLETRFREGQARPGYDRQGEVQTP